MLNRKTKKIIEVCLVLFLMASALPAIAVMRVNTANENPLQPMPKGVSANLSNNINASSSYNLNSETPSQPSFEEISPTTQIEFSDRGDNQTNRKPAFNISYWLISFIIVSAGLFWGLRKLK